MSDNRSRKAKRRDGSKRAETRQFVITMGAVKGGIIKVETLDASGERHDVSEHEFAALTGQDEVADLEDALEEAYAAGINDALEDSLEGDFDEDEEIRRTIMREAEARQLLRRGVRKLLLRRALQRGSQRKPVRAAHNGNGAQEAPKH